MTQNYEITNAEFKGMALEKLNNIECHLEELNGKVVSNLNRIDKMEDWRKELTTKQQMVAGIFIAIGSVVTFLANFVFDWYKSKFM